jgi:hypothetical protein
MHTEIYCEVMSTSIEEVPLTRSDVPLIESLNRCRAMLPARNWNRKKSRGGYAVKLNLPLASLLKLSHPVIGHRPKAACLPDLCWIYLRPRQA